ncbi:MAG: hypothetical protein EPN65_16570 [Pandoraea sp.]|uniref:hypothetical protein n=1 Tax=Pandoraea sp. TaxID=1883445 RepID=UPI00122BEC97|nr:hypothetical protein [Pandoraea sp.]TAM15927.1 MAG: hypothetical protein EPN65_16570 [Pandoraea sp.]
MTTLTTEKFDQWAIVELFGHQRIAGRITEQTIGGCAFVRIDVPACEADGSIPATQAFTKLFGNGAIYGVSFVDEQTARIAARQLRVQPINTYELRRALQDLPSIGGMPSRQPELIEDNDLPY